MRRASVALLAALVLGLGLAAAGCGGEEEATPTPETVTGPLPTETEPTETTTTETEPSGEEGDPVAGKEVFLGSSGCGNCHVLADAGTTGDVGPNLDETQPSYELTLDRVTNGTNAGMPSFSSSLSEQELADVAAYVSSAAGG